MRRNISFSLVGTICLLLFNSGRSDAATYTWNNYALAIGMDSPPALIFVQDSKNDITGADPSVGLNSLGNGSILQNIPGSWVEQDNSESDAVNGVASPGATTNWNVIIPDYSPQTFTINLQGDETGVSELSISGLFANGSKIPAIVDELDILVSKGITKQIHVTFDPTSRSLTSTPIINSGDFLQDTHAACGLNEISPPEACAVLKALASEVEQAITRGDTRAESSELNLYLLILNRLHNWGQVGFRQDWNDCLGYPECAPLCHIGIGNAAFFAKDPAYSVLKLDATTLLNAIPNKGR